MQNAFVFDDNKCTGCQACQIACTIENDLDPDMDWRQVDTFNESRLPGIPSFHHSLACNHCIEAPCMKYCPALAYSRDTQTGAVLIDKDSCIGCKYCTWVCPYDAPKYNQSKGVVEKCTFCNHRLQNGEKPACVTACPTDALQVEELHNGVHLNSVQGFSEVGIQPAIRIIPLREKQSTDQLLSKKDALNFPEIITGNSNQISKISLKSEWTLVVFTVLFAALTGLMTGTSYNTIQFQPLIFLAAGIIGMVLSVAHLGKITRFYRAIYNWKNSWLSREIICISLFMSLAVVYLFGLIVQDWIAWLTTAAGFAGLFCMDKIYYVVWDSRKVKIHSSQAVFSGILFTAILMQSPIIFTVATFVKAILYLLRKMSFIRTRQKSRPVLSFFRLITGFILPIALWFTAPVNSIHYIMASVVIGELIDRCEFYLEMVILTPKTQMTIDLEKQMI